MQKGSINVKYSELCLNLKLFFQTDVIAILEEIQTLIFEFLQRVLTSSNYVGITFNTYGHTQILFRLGPNSVLVLAVSSELYSRNPKCRPVREIITIFISNDDHTVGAQMVFATDDDPTKKLSKGPK